MWELTLFWLMFHHFGLVFIFNYRVELTKVISYNLEEFMNICISSFLKCSNDLATQIRLF